MNNIVIESTCLEITDAGLSVVNGKYLFSKNTNKQQNKHIKQDMMRFVQKCKKHPISGNPIQFQIIQKQIACLSSSLSKHPQTFFVLQSIATKYVPSIDYYVCPLNSKKWLSIGGIDPTPKLIAHVSNRNKNKIKGKKINKRQMSSKENMNVMNSTDIGNDHRCDQKCNDNQSSSNMNTNKVKNLKIDENVNTSDLTIIEPTIRTFLLNTYKFSHSDERIVFCGNDELFGDYLILNDTIFHCQGGGQPSDIGEIIGKNMDGKEIKFIVEKVFNHPQYPKLIVHSGHYSSCISDIQRFSSSAIPIAIEQNINKEKRELFAKLHSAGHILDIAMTLIGYGDDILIPRKGYHFPDGPYVEYEGNIDVKERGMAKEKLQAKLNELLSMDLYKNGSGIPCHVNQVPVDSYLKNILHISNDQELEEKRNGLSFAGFINSENCVRVVRFGDVNEYESSSCMCGGTHIDNSKRIRKIIIRKLYKKQKNFRVKYFVE